MSSVNSVFGENLRTLALSRSSLARAATDLGIGRIQFQRYLKGESFPKPGLLVRVCDYFDVDARIMTERMTPRLLADMRVGRYSDASQAVVGKWLEGLTYMAPSDEYHSAA